MQQRESLHLLNVFSFFETNLNFLQDRIGYDRIACNSILSFILHPASYILYPASYILSYPKSAKLFSSKVVAFVF